MRFSFLVIALVVAGCANEKQPPPPIVPVQGVVTLDGKPLNKVTVRFVPMIEYGAEYTARGVTDAAGRFTLTCKGQPGACAGENRVLILESEIPPRLRGENAQAELVKYLQGLGGRPLPPRYTNLADNPLSANVKSEQKEYSFELQR
jgi:hypothetical protein